MPHIVKSARLQRQLLQFGFVGMTALVIVSAVMMARENLAAQGLTSGFSFLTRTTGWDINFSLLAFEPNDTYARALIVGLTNTLFLSSIALPLATVIGITVAVMRTSGLALLELIGKLYVELFRNVPILLQLLFWYSLLRGLPQPRAAEGVLGLAFLTGRGLFVPALSVGGQQVGIAVCLLFLTLVLTLIVRLDGRLRSIPDALRCKMLCILWIVALAGVVLVLWMGRLPDQPFISLPQHKGLGIQGGGRISPELAAMVVAIAIYGGAYIAEIMRAGFKSVPKGQSEAAISLGLSPLQTFTRIRFPLALRAVLPTMTNQYVWLTKASTLGIAVGFADYFMIVSTSINQSGQTLELIGLLMAGFLMINYSLAWIMNRVNDALKLRGTQWRI